MHKTPAEWSKVQAAMVTAGSVAQATNVLQMALDDIAQLAAERHASIEAIMLIDARHEIESLMGEWAVSVDNAIELVERWHPDARLQLTRDPDLDGWWARFADDPNSVQAETASLAIMAALGRHGGAKE